MTTEEIDRLLAVWRDNISVSSQNLLALDDMHTFKRLKGDGSLHAAQLTGVTAARVPPALEAVARLFHYTQLLNDMMERAGRIRDAMPRLFASDRSRAQLEALLTGASIDLPPIKTPLSQRGLLSDAEKPSAITPDHLLEVMARTFQLAKSVILEVDEAWSRLEPELSAIDDEAARLAQAASAEGGRNLPELSALQSQIAVLRGKIETDPLGVGADLRREITPLLEIARVRVDQLVGAKVRVQAALARARNLMTEIESCHRESLAARDLCRRTIEEPTGLLPTLEASAPAQLNEWLQTLEATYHQGRTHPAEIGLQRWNDAANSSIVIARDSLKSSQAPVELLAELRGRFAAQKNRLRLSMPPGATLDPALDAIGRLAGRLLDADPVPLQRATSAVQQFENRLREVLHRT